MSEVSGKLPGSRVSQLVPVRDLSLTESMEPREMLLTVDTGVPYPQTNVMQEQDVLPLGKLGVITGTGGTGKTHLLTQLAISVATGEKWLNCFNVKNPGKVALLVCEEDFTEVKRRLLKAVNKRFQYADSSFLTRL
ncbi:AAA family ATPase, partial [Myxococcota bacterium]|nr:AAA family ATPase [Myxococcota bacterium]